MFLLELIIRRTAQTERSRSEAPRSGQRPASARGRSPRSRLHRDVGAMFV